MTSELLTYLKKHIESVVQNLYLSNLELGIVETVDENYDDLSIRLIDSGIVIPRQFLWISENLQNYNQQWKFESQQNTSSDGKPSHSHYFPENKDQVFESKILNILKVNDYVLVARIDKGERYVILTRVIQ